MKFKTDRANLHQAASKLLSIVPPKSTLPILSNILFELEKSKLSLKVTDLDVSMTSTIDVDAQKAGAVAVPAKVFYEIVRELPDFELEVSTYENRMEIKCGAGVYKMSGFSPEDFPKLPDVHIGRQVKIDGAILGRMVKKVLFAVSRDETRPALNGVLWHTTEEGLNMVATDGHRLAKVTRSDLKISGQGKDIIVPPKVLDNLVKLMGDEAGEVGIIVNEGSIVFVLGNSILTSRLLEGPYPNYEQVIPKDNSKRATMDKEILQAAVRRVAILSNTLTHQVKFSLKKDELELLATNFDFGGEAKEILKINYGADAMDIGYNANYIIDILRQTDGAEVLFDLNTATTAGIVRSAERVDNENYFFLVMPLRLLD
ncbi:MAG: DNA polymerase III subunit beta [candidate division Zixibacteria bacterium RBG_16_53_22]|nr:MAG: DNA polymerase III subunit beta [candidate division Zixibacteria bacterium RBG_16_53_22]